jgi:NAD(P)-dependent dehydrogenase (short-subunit alcohol dehydrogenase family)
MIAQKYGRIINISSGAVLGTIGEVVYGAAKSGVLGLTRGLAKEVKEYGITVNAIMPAARTRMTAAASSSAAVKQPSGIGIDQPPETIAPLIAYLASERAARITGRTLALRYARTVQLMSDPTPVGSAYTPGETWTIEELDKVMPSLVPEI